MRTGPGNETGCDRAIAGRPKAAQELEKQALNNALSQVRDQALYCASSKISHITCHLRKIGQPKWSVKNA